MGAIPTSDMPGHHRLHERVTAALDRCQESPDVDFKESAPWNQLRPRIIKTALAMANLRDGGIVVIGASERGQTWDLSGISDDHLQSYEVDDVVGAIDAHASPHVDVDVVLVNYANGRRFLAIQVNEFEESPVVCKRALGQVLTAGDIVVRPAGTPRTTKVQDAHQLHELLELAAEKRARRLLGTARRVGLEPAPTADQNYDEELKRAGALRVPRVMEVPHWRVVLRPAEYEAERIGSVSEAREMVAQCHLRWGGWSYPVFLRPEEFHGAGTDWISGSFGSSDRPEEWRLFFSGQFIHYLGISSAIPGPDREQHERWARQHLSFRPDVPWDMIRGYLGLQAANGFLAQVFEFAGRLCERGVTGKGCALEVALVNIRDVALTTEPMRLWPDLCVATTDKLSKRWAFNAESLVVDRVTPAVDAAIWFFERFGWDDPAREVIRQDVEAFRSGR